MTIQEQILKVEAEAKYAAAKEVKDASNIDYIAMMSDIELEDEEVEASEQEV